MGLITLRAKVKLMNEEEMELVQGRDLGSLDLKSEKWVWRNKVVRESNIIDITRYNSTKTLVYLTYGRTLLVDEKFEDVYKKWWEVFEYGEEQDNPSDEINSEEEED